MLSVIHLRFPEQFTTPFGALLLATLRPPNKATLAALSVEQREKDESARIVRQRTALRVLGELEAAGIVRLDGTRGEGEQTFAVLKDLVRTPAYSI